MDFKGFLEALPRGLRLSAARDLQEERLKVSAYLTLAEGGNKLLGTGLLGLQELQAHRGGPRFGSRVGAIGDIRRLVRPYRGRIGYRTR